MPGRPAEPMVALLGWIAHGAPPRPVDSLTAGAARGALWSFGRFVEGAERPTPPSAAPEPRVALGAWQRSVGFELGSSLLSAGSGPPCPGRVRPAGASPRRGGDAARRAAP
jgi:hypothetical protein